MVSPNDQRQTALKMSGLPKGKHKLLQTDRMYAVYRLEKAKHGQDAWIVNMSRGGTPIHMIFSDVTYGGKAAVLTLRSTRRRQVQVSDAATEAAE